MLQHQAGQRGLFRAVARVVDRHAIRRPLKCRPMAHTMAARWGDLHGLNPRAAPQSFRLLPADACPPRRGLLRVPVFESERQLCGNEISEANVS